jgi:succinate dehydrogenase flavin-adding protein (antitoxin of CptAB toxin-antitoxin module)
MRELDVLLTRYLDDRYTSAPGEEKAGFRRLLELPDPDLIAYLLNAEKPADKELCNVIDRIRGGGPD